MAEEHEHTHSDRETHSHPHVREQGLEEEHQLDAIY